jgi:hypothetical protein
VRLAIAAIAAFALSLGLAPAASATVVTGRLEVRHADDFRHDRSLTTYAVRADGHRTPILPTSPPDVDSGTAVRVAGSESGGMVVGSVTPTRAASTTAPAIRTRRAAVILLNFTADTRQPWTPSHVADRFFNDSDSTAAFYREESYGDLALTGDVYGWYTIDQPNDGCDVDAWAAAARSKAAAAGVDLSRYDHLVYVFPFQSSCWWAGLGDLPGRESWLNGYVEPWVAGHELGHNLGEHHASSFTCTDGTTPVTLGASCSQDEYGDPFDIMGDGVSRGSGWHLQQLGFLGPGDVQQVTTTGLYTLRSSSSRGSGPDLVRIPTTPTGDGLDQYLDLDLRQPDGVFDWFGATDPVSNGVSIHLDPDPSVVTQSLLLDATPGSDAGFDDSALAAGQTFQWGAARVTVRSVSGGGATLAITIAGSPDSIAPDAPGALAVTVDGTDANLSWTPAADNVGVAGYRVYRDGALVGTTQDTAFADHGLVPGASYLYRVDAYDEAGNATASDAVVAAVPPAPGDPGTGDPGTGDPGTTDPGGGTNPGTTDPGSTDPGGSNPGTTDPGGTTHPGTNDPGTKTPPPTGLPPTRNPVHNPPATTPERTRPKVVIRSPRRGKVVRRPRLAIRVGSSGRVVRIVVRIDGQRRLTVRHHVVRRHISLRHLRRGRHRLTVRAIDSHGRVTTRTIRFRYVPRHHRG